MTEGVTSMSTRTPATARVPRHVALFSSILKFLVVHGVPLGPNGLITIRGRISGQPRTAAVAILNVGGRRWVWCPWGDVNWVRNLRAAGEATLSFRGHEVAVRAKELDQAERIAFFRDVIGSYARRLRGGVTFVRLIDGVDLNRPVDAADGTAVFELEAR